MFLLILWSGLGKDAVHHALEHSASISMDIQLYNAKETSNKANPASPYIFGAVISIEVHAMI